MRSRETDSISETEGLNIASKALLKGGKPMAVILIPSESGIGSLQTN